MPFFLAVNIPYEKDKVLLDRIYENLQLAVGDQRFDWPQIEIIGVKNRGAAYLSKANTILVDQLLIDECLTYEDRAEDALAFILAHELTHFYQSHRWAESGFVSGIENDADSNLRKQQERQADIFGSFIARQAGYDVFSIAQEVMRKIYSTYGLAEVENGNYPSLNERIELTGEACALASILFEAYTMGNYALVAGQYPVAIQLFEFVQDHIQFKELQHNLGMVYLGMLYDKVRPNLYYSLLVDHNSPILRATHDFTSEQLFALASKKFRTVLDKYDGEYSASLSALIGLHAIQNQSITDLLHDIKVDNLSASAKLNLANYYHNRNELGRANGLYKEIASNSETPVYLREFAKKNISGTDLKKHSNKRIMISSEENIDGVASIIFIDNLDQRFGITSTTDFSIQQEDNSILSQIRSPHNICSLQRVYSEGAKSELGIKVGSGLDEVEAAYPSIEIRFGTATDGFWGLVESRGLFFRFSSEAIVEEWGLLSY